MAITLEKFLFCLELQLGGIIMGWWGMIMSALSIITVLFGTFSNGSFSIQHWFPFLGRGGSFAGGLFAVLFLVVYFYFSYQLLLGAQSGNSSQMFGYLIVHGILVIFFVLGVFQNVGSLLGAILYVYFWFCIYSLYVRSGGSGIV